MGLGDYRLGFSHYNYSDIYQNKDFHHCGTPGNAIKDWNNRWQIQNCELDGLAEYVPSLLEGTYAVISLLFFLQFGNWERIRAGEPRRLRERALEFGD